MIRMVFVCSGNICRSPMAAELAKEELKQRGVSAAVISGGTLGILGKPAAEYARAVMREIDLDIDSHYSQGAEAGLMSLADFIVVMAPRHERLIVEASAKLAPQIVRMWEFSESDLTQIDDPVGKDIAAFRVCRDRLKECVSHWLDSLELSPT